MLGFHNP